MTELFIGLVVGFLTGWAYSETKLDKIRVEINELKQKLKQEQYKRNNPNG